MCGCDVWSACKRLPTVHPSQSIGRGSIGPRQLPGYPPPIQPCTTPLLCPCYGSTRPVSSLPFPITVMMFKLNCSSIDKTIQFRHQANDTKPPNTELALATPLVSDQPMVYSVRKLIQLCRCSACLDSLSLTLPPLRGQWESSKVESDILPFSYPRLMVMCLP